MDLELDAMADRELAWEPLLRLRLPVEISTAASRLTGTVGV
jgi:hypothetical protein